MTAPTEAIARLEAASKWTDGRGEPLDNVFVIAADLSAALAYTETLEGALESAVKVAREAADEWDRAPAGMKAGKLLIALSGNFPKYRADIDAIHAARALNGASHDQG